MIDIKKFADETFPGIKVLRETHDPETNVLVRLYLTEWEGRDRYWAWMFTPAKIARDHDELSFLRPEECGRDRDMNEECSFFHYSVEQDRDVAELDYEVLLHDMQTARAVSGLAI